MTGVKKPAASGGPSTKAKDDAVQKSGSAANAAKSGAAGGKPKKAASDVDSAKNTGSQSEKSPTPKVDPKAANTRKATTTVGQPDSKPQSEMSDPHDLKKASDALQSALTDEEKSKLTPGKNAGKDAGRNADKDTRKDTRKDAETLESALTDEEKSKLTPGKDSSKPIGVGATEEGAPTEGHTAAQKRGEAIEGVNPTSQGVEVGEVPSEGDDAQRDEWEFPEADGSEGGDVPKDVDDGGDISEGDKLEGDEDDDGKNESDIPEDDVLQDDVPDDEDDVLEDEGNIPAEGEIFEGDEPEGEEPEGDEVEGGENESDIPEGDDLQGEVLDDEDDVLEDEGSIPAEDGDIPEDDEDEGDIPEGDVPEGDVPEVDESAAGYDAVDEGENVAQEDEGGLEDDGNDEEASSDEAVPDLPPLKVLKDGRVNKGGNVIDENNKIIGRVKEGVLSKLVGKRVDENGDIWNDSGKKVGVAEPIPDDELEAMLKEPAPFEAFPDAVVDREGYVVFNEERVGKVTKGDIKQLRGMKVDEDGDILDRVGSVIGHAERWEEEPEPEPEPKEEEDCSILAGKRVNKGGNVVDSSGNIYGRVIDGDVKRMVGRMCDKKGNILSESGDVLGKAELVPEGDREGSKDGPFAGLSGCTVAKNGKVVAPGGDIVGRLTEGDPKALSGRVVDDDGDICDKNGNVLGHAERWEEEETEKQKDPMSGRRVNREGNVVDEDGNLIGKLTSGDLSICSGKEIDDDGDVVDGKGVTVGHVSLIQDIPESEPEEGAEAKEKREQAEKDKKLAQQMAYCVTQTLDKVKPICDTITRKIEAAERMPKEELDEEQLVREVRPLIEDGGKLLSEANGIIRSLDPDGRIQQNAKQKSATHEATPEEYFLADVLKELTATVAQTIEGAKRKLEGMPHAKDELNPLWGLLNEPLVQILAGVGLLLGGVLGIVGRLLNGLGLGGLVNGLLGSLGIGPLLDKLGLGSATGKGKKKQGLLGGLGL